MFTYDILESLVYSQSTATGKVLGYTDGGKIIVEGVSGAQQIVSNATGASISVGASVIVGTSGSDMTIIGTIGIREEFEIINIRG